MENLLLGQLAHKMHTTELKLSVASSNNAYVSPLSADMVHNLSSGHYTHLGHSYIAE